MTALEKLKAELVKIKEFGPTTWAIKNRTSVYLLIIFISIWGIVQFVTTPKEQFPDIVIPTIYVQTIYVGNSPKDIENLVTRPIEKQIKGITGAKINKINSTSLQDFSAITIEFDTDVVPDVALQKVKDAVDKAKKDLPNDLTDDPTVQEVSFSEFPIMYVNLSGPYSEVKLKEYADDLQDKLEELKEVTRVDLVGAPEREIQININTLKMEGAGISFGDIEAAVARENLDISAGLLQVGDMKRNMQIKGQFKSAFDLYNIVIRNNQGQAIYLKDVAEIKDTIKERESYARLGDNNTLSQPVITLNIIKRSGENLIEAADGVKRIVEAFKKNELPRDMNVVITADQSKATKASFNELVNTIVLGFIFVLLILMFFMGVTNAFFVALSVPLSIFVAFIFLPVGSVIVGSNITLNFIVLFALLFGLGIIVDDAIVVIENTHRIFTEGQGQISSEMAARYASGEVFIPVLSGTLTTLAPFFPLLFWPGIIGKFMVYLPAMLIFTLAASLIVAFLFNTVFAVDFMNHPEGKPAKKSAVFKSKTFNILMAAGIMFDVAGFFLGGGLWYFFGNLSIFSALVVVFYTYVLNDAIHAFQNKILPALMRRYEVLLRWTLEGWRPVWLIVGVFGILVGSFVIFGAAVGSGRVPIVFFPSGDPNFVYVYFKFPSGTDVRYTDSVVNTMESRVYKVLGMEKGKKNPLVESVITNIAVGASDPNSGDRSTRPELGRIQVSFVEFEERHGKSTKPYLDSIRAAIKGIAGAEISVAQEQSGPPTQPPVNIEVSGENFETLTRTAVALKNYLDTNKVAGIEELKIDVDLTNPEVTITIDRERALIEGISTAQIGLELRTALFGKEISKLKEDEEEYKIQLRSSEMKRHNLTDLLNMNISFRDMNSGQLKSVPISAVTRIELTNTYGSIKRKNLKRVITLYSNVLTGYTPTAVNLELKKIIDNFKQKPADVSIAQTGEGEQQEETGAFLSGALLVALALILFVLVLQFNSVSKPIIILMEIVFSIIGVLLGFAITGMEVSVVMTGIGIVGLAGIVVKNGILVIEFADELRKRGERTHEAIVQAGKTRIIPVLLTAIATMLGLVPLAVGLNLNFIAMFEELNPHLYFGGDSAVFWKPLSWTIIYGLILAFFMTLLVVPAMYLIAERLRRPMRRMWGGKWVSMMAIPPLTPIFLVMLFITMIAHRVEVKRRMRRMDNKANEKWVKSWF
ncbi:MAG: efflux RND transporter permease subunit [Chitinophagaceae bacterium]|nr:efflux RND transporter permease subunit [Chitinophagaceae bacterium]